MNPFIHPSKSEFATIQKQIFKKAIEGNKYQDWNFNLSKMILKTFNYLKYNEMEWISVKDRLPENEHAVLGLSLDYISIHYSIVCYFHDNNEWIVSSTGQNIKKWITYWMPLPEPPKEQK